MGGGDVDVVVVGAGLSGIGAACHLARDCPEESVVVLEARDRVGGTWDLFRYPGVRSDSSMFTYAYDFAPWTGPTAIAEGADILAYLEETARAYGVDERVRLGHRVVRAAWSSDEARWRVTVAHDGSESVVVCRFLWVCTGYYRYDHGHVPELAGREEFGGRLVHPQAWPADLDVAGRDVVVIGSGATAVTLVPALVDRGARVTMVQRSPSYVASVPRLTRGGAVRAGPRDRVTQTVPLRAQPPLPRPGAVLAAEATSPAGSRPATTSRPTSRPRYEPWDQRLCVEPGGRPVRRDRVGAGRGRDGHGGTPHRERGAHDVGAGAARRRRRHRDRAGAAGPRRARAGRRRPAVDPATCLTWRGLMLSGVPNLALTLGYSAASWTLRADLVARFVTRLLRGCGAGGWRA